MKIGIVAEGATDLPILEEIITHELMKLGFNLEEIHIESIIPKVDRTGAGHHDSAGWTIVSQWWKNNGPQTRVSEYFTPIFMGVEPFDLLIAHIDADIASFAAREFSLCLDDLPNFKHLRMQPVVFQPRDMGHLMRQIIELWMWPPGERPEEHRHIQFVAVLSSEAWLTATAFGTSDVEDMSTAVLIRRINPGLVNGAGYVSKKPDKWKKLVRKHLAGKVDQVTQLCPGLAHNLSGLAKAVGHLGTVSERSEIVEREE